MVGFGRTLGGVGTFTFSMSNILGAGLVRVNRSKRLLHSVGAGSKCTLRHTHHLKCPVTVVAKTSGRFVGRRCRGVNTSICVSTRAGVGRFGSFLDHRGLGTRSILCVNSSVPSCRMVGIYKLTAYPLSTTRRVGTVTRCISSRGTNRKYIHSIVRRALHARKG